MTTKFVRIETEKEGVHHINTAFILDVWPSDKKSFDSGAAVEVGGIDSSFIYLIPPGAETNRLIDALGLI